MGTHQEANNIMPFELLDNSKSRRTKESLKKRKDQEVRIGDHEKIIAPDIVTRNGDARKRWKELMKLYRDAGVTFVTSADTELLTRYCILYSETRKLIKAGEQFDLAAGENPIIAMSLKEDANYFLRLKQIGEDMLKMENALFLTPVSRVRGVAKEAREQEKKKQSRLSKKGFGEV